MLFALLSVFAVMVWVVVGTSRLKLHPFLVLLIGAISLGFLIGLPPFTVFATLIKGFGGTVQGIGLLILFGTLIGTSLERSGGAQALANGLLHYLHKLPLPLAISCIGYVVSIPVFCDAAFVILAQLNKSLAHKTKTSLVGLSVALSTGLFAPHVLVPPTPGPLAAAANLELSNLSFLIITGAVIAFILILVGGVFALYLSKKYPYVDQGHELAAPALTTEQLPSLTKAFLPILLPLLLMCLGAFIPKETLPEQTEKALLLISNPIAALGIGMAFSFLLLIPFGKTGLREATTKGIKQAIPILLITGMGGALGKMIGQISLQEHLATMATLDQLGLLIPFFIAALLKTAQGSSTVAIITTASIVFPLLSLLGLDSEMGKVWAIMAIGTGAMTVSHANDSYFWIVSQMSQMDVKTAYKTHTLGTLVQGSVGLVVVLGGYYCWLCFF